MLIIILAASALFVSLITPIFADFIGEFSGTLASFELSFFNNPFKSAETAILSFVSFFNANAGSLFLRILALAGLMAAIRFLITLCLMPVSKILHDKMTTGFDMGFNNAFISTLSQNLLFSVICSVVLTVIDSLLIFGILYALYGLVKLIGLFGIPIALILAVFIFSVRMAAVCMWLPEMNNQNSKNIFKALAAARKPTLKYFRKNTLCLMVINTVTLSLMLVSLIPTVGLLPILLVPTYLVLYTALCNALSYSFYQKKYFIDNGVTVYQSVKKY